MSKEYLKVLFIFISCFKYASCIRCFECTSQNNSMCLDPSSYDEETLRKFLPVATCGHGLYGNNHNFFCRKIVQTIFHKHYEPDVRVTRTCGWISHHRECYKADNEDHLETVCQCFTDQCNHASSLTTTSLISMMGFIFINLCI